MYKITFEASYGYPAKKVVKEDDKTTVTLHGILTLPSNCLFKFASLQHGYRRNLGNGRYEIVVLATSKHHKNDKYDSLLGERLAEAYAKRDLYKYVYKTLDNKLGLILTFLGVDPEDIKQYDRGALISSVNKYRRLYEHELKHIENLLTSLKHE